MILQDIVLGFIQGIAEFLPISSSAHLALLPKLFSWQDQGIIFDASLHLGTLLAVLVYFRKRIWKVIRDRDWVFVKMILVATMATIVMVLVAKNFIFRSPELIAINLIIWAVVLYIADKYSDKLVRYKKNNLKTSLVVGIAQGIAVLPGTSRSGITISTGLLKGLGKEEAVEFSFLLGIPIIFLAGVDSLYDLTKATGIVFSWSDLLLAMTVAFVSGLVAIHFLLAIIKKVGFKWFVWYRVALGLLILFLL